MLENVKKCEFCGCEIDEKNAREFDGVVMCDDCFEERVTTCEECNELCWYDDLNWLENYNCYVCNDCLTGNYTTCVDCGEWISDNDYSNQYTLANGEIICAHCREYNDYYCCDDCGELFYCDDLYYNEDTDCYYCCECEQRHNNEVIHSYYYKPDPIFYHMENETKQNLLYMGIELEVDNGGEDSENAETILNIFNAERETVYIKHDGSLEEGFEIVSHPATLNYHLNNVKWLNAFPKLVEMGYRSHNTDSCGLHIHISRNALGNTHEEIENNIAKILFFIENNWDNILRFTRRTEYRMERWASRYGLEKDSCELYKKAKNDNYNRYRCVNLLNHNTVEFRMFRGTLNSTTFKATLQFVSVLCEMCNKHSTKFIETLSWLDFTRAIDCKKYSELIEYLKIRELY